jgi:RNA polymerase sigma-70 factor, ECF subfamily
MLKVFANGSHAGDPGDLTFRSLRLLDDESLMAHVKTSSGDALAVLFDRYQRLVYHIALKILRNIEDAEDVVQNVFLEISQMAQRFDPERGTVRTWILLYAYHRSMDRRQQLQRYCNGFVGAEMPYLLGRSAHDAERSFVSKRQIEQALGVLKPMQRRIFELVCFEGLSFQEIAESVGETCGNVRHHYYRGLCKLRIFLMNAGGARKEYGHEGTQGSVPAQVGVPQ